MKNNDLLEKVLTVAMDNDLKNDILRYIFKDAVRRTNAIPQLKDWPSKLDYEAIYSRMTSIVGGTGADVARLLGVSSQAINNQRLRKSISGKTIIDFHKKTGVSLDWLVGSWSGDIEAYGDCNRLQLDEPPIKTDHSAPKYLSLVEVLDQQSGEVELKWCLTQHRICLDNDNLPVPADYGALYSLIIRYKDESGTPEKVRKGKKHHFQVRKLLAYVLGSPKIIRQLDAAAKSLTISYKSSELERTGKTEFRLYSSMDACLNTLHMLAEQNGLRMIKPEFNSIAWDFLIGASCMSPRDWILSRLNLSRTAIASKQVTNSTILEGLPASDNAFMNSGSVTEYMPLSH